MIRVLKISHAVLHVRDTTTVNQIAHLSIGTPELTDRSKQHLPHLVEGDEDLSGKMVPR